MKGNTNDPTTRRIDSNLYPVSLGRAREIHQGNCQRAREFQRGKKVFPKIGGFSVGEKTLSFLGRSLVVGGLWAEKVDRVGEGLGWKELGLNISYYDSG